MVLRHWVKPAGLTVALALAVLGLIGCSDEDRLRSSVLLESINQGEPILSDVFSLGRDIEDPRDDTVPEDVISVVFRNTPLDPALAPEPNKPFGDVVITKYLVEFDVPDADLASVGGGMYLKISTGQTAEALIIAMRSGPKMLPPLVQLIGGGGLGEISGVANFTFWGKELQTDEPFVIRASLLCNFADFADE
jgi:hypothetical protein